MRYDWVVVGGGIAGICLAEILTREGKHVLLVEKQAQLAGATTKGFHEWIHTGSLYTLVPDRLSTLRFLMGAMDDLLEYYNCFNNMNVAPTESGLLIKDKPGGWFYNEHILFKYRLRRLNLPWLALVARSTSIINMIKQHDWLRRRGGVLERQTRGHVFRELASLLRLAWSRNEYSEVTSPDFTTNSRSMLADMIATASDNGLELQLNTSVEKIVRKNGVVEVITDGGTFAAEQAAVCCGKHVADFTNVRVKTSFAPMAVVRQLEPGARSFVHLDYHTRNCINLVVKENGVGLIGGISLNHRKDCAEYLEYVIREHSKMHPRLEVLGSYIGEKDEITFRGQNRNYLFHIVETLEKVWCVVPGKYTLGFSLAPEFYRRIYKRNPSKHRATHQDDGRFRSLIADTCWQELAKASTDGDYNGDDHTTGERNRALQGQSG